MRLLLLSVLGLSAVLRAPAEEPLILEFEISLADRELEPKPEESTTEADGDDHDDPTTQFGKYAHIPSMHAHT